MVGWGFLSVLNLSGVVCDWLGEWCEVFGWYRGVSLECVQCVCEFSLYKNCCLYTLTNLVVFSVNGT